MNRSIILITHLLILLSINTYGQGNLNARYGIAHFGSGDLIGDVAGVGYSYYFNDVLGVAAEVQLFWADRIEEQNFDQASSISLNLGVTIHPIRSVQRLNVFVGGSLRRSITIYGTDY